MSRNQLLAAIVCLSILSSAAASKICPRGCSCIDNLLITKCDGTAQLDYVPHTLNPAVKELHLPHNNIRSIKSAFDVYKNLIFLDLTGNFIQSLSEKSFASNSKMESILLTGNNITEIQTNSFVGLVSLKKLDLSHNAIGAIKENVFQNLKSLEVLDLSFNSLKMLSDNAFYGLSTLSHLNLSNNLIAHVSSNLFKNVPNLITLNASYNEFEQIFGEQFSSLNKLFDLDLSHCRIKQIDRHALRGLHNLTILYLDSNNLEKIPSEAFFPANVIQILYIGNNPFTMIPSRAFYNLRHLKRLHILNATYLTDVEGDAFNGLENMQLLDLSNNQMLKHISRSAFDSLFSLTSLLMSNNNFSTLEVDLISRYKKSDLYLDVRGNPFTCNCSLEWLNFHLIRMFNKTISSDPDYFITNNVTLPIYNLDSLLNNNYSEIIIMQNALDVRCAAPFALDNKLIIKLHKDKFGCFVLESIVPIIVGGVIGVLILLSVVVLMVIRCKYQLSGFVKNQLYTENARNQFDLYQKPEFIFAPNYNELYRTQRNFEDLAVRYPLKMTPTTEL